MKTRQGFVSNSSSSSFVVIGARIPQSELRDLGWEDEEAGYDYDKIPEGIQVYYDDNAYIVGTPICKSEDWGLCGNEMTQTQISEVFYQVSRKLPGKEIKLLMGTRPT